MGQYWNIPVSLFRFMLAGHGHIPVSANTIWSNTSHFPAHKMPI